MVKSIKDIKRKRFMGSMAKKYAVGGSVPKGPTTDTVPAMLTPGEVVLNAEQQSRLGKKFGQPSENIFKSIGVPGYEGGGKVRKMKQESYAYLLKRKLNRS